MTKQVRQGPTYLTLDLPSPSLHDLDSLHKLSFLFQAFKLWLHLRVSTLALSFNLDTFLIDFERSTYLTKTHIQILSRVVSLGSCSLSAP